MRRRILTRVGRQKKGKLRLWKEEKKKKKRLRH